jgi:hypothetical protein
MYCDIILIHEYQEIDWFSYLFLFMIFKLAKIAMDIITVDRLDLSHLNLLLLYYFSKSAMEILLFLTKFHYNHRGLSVDTFVIVYPIFEKCIYQKFNMENLTLKNSIFLEGVVFVLSSCNFGGVLYYRRCYF